MDWQIYKKRYNVFVASLNASEFLTCVSSIIFKDFPVNLPPEILRAVATPIKQLLLWAKSSGTLKKPQLDQLDKYLGKYEDLEIISIYSEIWAPYLMLLMVETEMKDRFQWDKLAISQQLIMIFTFFDSFFSDSIRSICEIKPDILRRDRKISWREVLELGNFDNLLQHLIEAFVFKPSWNNIKKRLKNVEKEINLKLDIPEDDKNFLHKAQQIRHLLVHSGGRVTPEFLRRSGSSAKGLKIGDYVNIDLDYLKKLNYLILKVGSKLFLEVSTKFFGISRKKALKVCWILKYKPN